ncbi:nuclear transport factor 2 family protein [Prauserella alba]|uniref:SnoaL-like domain-containing protein n=1 Tax=Prauserella alba TaxID=176898 RepID=A0ABP4G838_9PSEU|nr:nuclear transport factor 2 family protein [Prauserella alba]MCP2181081.1 SnoaL-like domain-containing protein [Prauserella alba]
MAVEITGTDACGNSPKNVFVARFEEQLARGDTDALAAVLAPECVLDVVGSGGVRTVEGREAAAAALAEIVPKGLTGAHVEAAVTHGKAAAAWGSWTLRGEIVQWSHVFWFRTLKAQDFDRIRVFGG